MQSIAPRIHLVEYRPGSQRAMPVGKVIEDDQTFERYAIRTPQCTWNSKVLGVGLHSFKDQINFYLTSIIDFARALPPKNRSWHKIAAKTFDPICCLNLSTSNYKILFQQLCIDKGEHRLDLIDRSHTREI